MSIASKHFEFGIFVKEVPGVQHEIFALAKNKLF
jgi:hypothetical protein